MKIKEIKNIILLMIIVAVFVTSICFVVFCFSLGLYHAYYLSPVLCIGGLCVSFVGIFILKNQIDL